MTDVTYDAEADAVYITIGPAIAERSKKTGPFVYDLDAGGRIVGIEIKSASKVLGSGAWKKARPPKEGARQRTRVAELHRGFLFIRRFSPPDDE
jgi:uncharacterized protein YuzE